MRFSIDPDSTYRIRSRGIERPPVEGHRLEQMVRDLRLARHDELSADGIAWFSAGDVDSLFPPPVSAARLTRTRQVFDAAEVAGAKTIIADPTTTGLDENKRFPREPWYVARGSNVAGPYDQVMIANWYQQGCLLGKDQLRPGLHATWRSMADASRAGLLAPPSSNTVAASANHLVADPPVWMGPPAQAIAASTTPSRLALAPERSQETSNGILYVVIGFAILGGTAILSGFGVAIYFAMR